MELVKPREEIIEVEESKTSGPIVWDFVEDILSKKKNLFSEDTQKNYASYIVNRALSGHIDCVRLVQEINQRHSLDKDLQHDFLFYGIQKKHRSRVRWLKADKDEDVELLSEYYGYNKKLSEQVLPLHSKEDINFIKHSMRKGGTKSGKRKP